VLAKKTSQTIEMEHSLCHFGMVTMAQQNFHFSLSYSRTHAKLQINHTFQFLQRKGKPGNNTNLGFINNDHKLGRSALHHLNRNGPPEPSG